MANIERTAELCPGPASAQVEIWEPTGYGRRLHACSFSRKEIDLALALGLATMAGLRLYVEGVTFTVTYDVAETTGGARG